jgi:hypothetical protein
MNKQEKHLGSVPEDIEDVLKLVEKSYDLRFKENELGHIRTFGELTDHIIAKVKLESKKDCTDQQAFYKLRTAILEIKSADKSSIEPKTLLTDLFSRQTRLKEIGKIQKLLGIDLDALRPKRFIINSLTIAFVLSIIGLFFYWQLGLTGVIISIVGLWIADKTGKEFKDKTLGELTDRMTQLNYVKSRRDSRTVNVDDVHTKIEKLFVENLGLEEKTIDRDTVIV